MRNNKKELFIVLNEYYRDQKSFTRQDIVNRVPSLTKNSISNLLSQLKRIGYLSRYSRRHTNLFECRVLKEIPLDLKYSYIYEEIKERQKSKGVKIFDLVKNKFKGKTIKINNSDEVIQIKTIKKGTGDCVCIISNGQTEYYIYPQTIFELC